MRNIFFVPILLALLGCSGVRWSPGLADLPSVALQNPTECDCMVVLSSNSVIRPLGSGEIVDGQRVPSKRAISRFWNPTFEIVAGTTLNFQLEQRSSTSQARVAILVMPADERCTGHYETDVSFYHHPIYSDPYRRNRLERRSISNIRPARR